MQADGGLRRIFRAHLPQVHWTSIESALTGSGIPDSNGCCEGVEFWVEHKTTASWMIKLRPGQYAWGSRRTRAGGRVFVAVRRLAAAGPRKGVACDELWLVPFRHAETLLEKGLAPFRASRPEDIGRWPGGAMEWDWAAVLARLTGK